LEAQESQKYFTSGTNRTSRTNQAKNSINQYPCQAIAKPFSNLPDPRRDHKRQTIYFLNWISNVRLLIMLNSYIRGLTYILKTSEKKTGGQADACYCLLPMRLRGNKKKEKALNNINITILIVEQTEK